MLQQHTVVDTKFEPPEEKNQKRSTEEKFNLIKLMNLCSVNVFQIKFICFYTLFINYLNKFEPG